MNTRRRRWSQAFVDNDNSLGMLYCFCRLAPRVTTDSFDIGSAVPILRYLGVLLVCRQLLMSSSKLILLVILRRAMFCGSLGCGFSVKQTRHGSELIIWEDFQMRPRCCIIDSNDECKHNTIAISSTSTAHTPPQLFLLLQSHRVFTPHPLPAASSNPDTVVTLYPLLFNTGKTFLNIGAVHPLRS